jgi:polyisoprenoid-binding protein YceI
MRPMSHAVLAVLITLAVPHRVARAFESESPIRPESRVWITGASNIRHFTCKAKRLSGAIDLRGSTVPADVLSGANMSSQPSLNVSVDKLDCGIGVMSRHLRETLRSAHHPTIEFRLSTYEVDLKGPTPVARISGLVIIAGVLRPVTTTAAVRADALGVLHIAGTYAVRPTDFGVQPPRRFAGLLRVRDRITVHFDVALDPDGGAINEIGCSLLRSTRAALEPELTNASH